MWVPSHCGLNVLFKIAFFPLRIAEVLKRLLFVIASYDFFSLLWKNGLFSKGGVSPQEIFLSKEELLAESNTSCDFNTLKLSS